MNKNYYFIAAILLIAVAIGAVLYSQNNNSSRLAGEKDSNSEQESMMSDDKMSTEKTGEAMMNDDAKTSDQMMGSDSMMAKAGSYKDYSSELVASEQAAGNKVVLFFHAPWCPFCKAADKAFKENLNEIPTGVTILKTDYDSNTELKKKYGVTYQHTFVQIDNQGNTVTKWNGGDIAELKSNLK